MSKVNEILIGHINEILDNESIQINESFECDILTRASKSIKELSKIQKEKYPDSSPSTFKFLTLKQFLQYSYVPASKLTNDMVEKIEQGIKNLALFVLSRRC